MLEGGGLLDCLAREVAGRGWGVPRVDRHEPVSSEAILPSCIPHELAQLERGSTDGEEEEWL